MTAPLDMLSAYEAAEVEVELDDGASRSRLAEGGGLADAFERLGRGLLRAALASGARAVRLTDGALQIRATRGGHLVVSWDERVVIDEPLGAHHAPAFHVPPVDPARLGAASFRAAHGVRWAYVAGAMAGGIASVALVDAMARAGLMAFFGSGGLPLSAVEEALVALGDTPGAWGFNLLHNPSEPAVEEATVDAYLRHGVRRVSASAYMRLTPAVVRYRLHGITRGDDGRVRCPNHVFAKVSRPEVAEPFLRPAPEAIVSELVACGALTEAQARLAREVPVAEDITAEGDSGGHTDHRPLVVLLPVLQQVRDRVATEEGYAARGVTLRVGAAGGLGTPAAVWAAFAMGADYVLTGSVNQATREAGTSALAKAMLAEASFTDVDSGPAPDMFELGAKVQVLSRGSLYARRSQRLYDLYRAHPSMDAIPADERAKIEGQLFRAPLSEVWAGTRDYWQQRDAAQVARAEDDPRHKMALTFRWYLGMTSRWARLGDADRKRDFQLWCGPSMGAFNAWAAGGPLAPVGARTVVGVAEALMHGAAEHARASVTRVMGGAT